MGNKEEYIEEELSEDSELEEDLNAREDFRQCGIELTQLLADGEEVPDELYVRLYVAKLRYTHPHKSKK